MGCAQGKFTGCEDDFDHLKVNFSYKEVQVETFCLPVKSSCLPVENVNETSVKISLRSCGRLHAKSTEWEIHLPGLHVPFSLFPARV